MSYVQKTPGGDKLTKVFNFVYARYADQDEKLAADFVAADAPKSVTYGWRMYDSAEIIKQTKAMDSWLKAGAHGKELGMLDNKRSQLQSYYATNIDSL